MRLHERTLVRVEIAPRIRSVGALGGRKQAFSQDVTAARGSVLPQQGGLSRRESGLCAKECVRALVPADVSVSPGDKITAEGRDYLVVSALRWQGHIELECEALA